MSLLRTAARASVATRVAGNVHRRQQQRWANQDAPASQVAPPAAPVPGDRTIPGGPPAAADTDRLIEQLTRLGALRDSGVLTEAEFGAQKHRLLGS